jgi:hypothetical protein
MTFKKSSNLFLDFSHRMEMGALEDWNFWLNILYCHFVFFLVNLLYDLFCMASELEFQRPLLEVPPS